MDAYRVTGFPAGLSRASKYLDVRFSCNHIRRGFPYQKNMFVSLFKET